MTAWQRWGVFGLTVVALCLRLWGADQAAPYVPDTQIIREALDLGQKLANGSANFDIGLGGASKYPYVLPYLLLPVYGVILIGGRVSGVFHSTQDFVSWLFLNRVAIHVVTVTLIASLSALMVPVTFAIARRFNRGLGPWLAATFVTFSVTLIHFSHHARPHLPLAFFILLALYFSLRVYDTKSLRHYILAGGSVALAIGTLQSGVLAVVPFGVAHLLGIDFRHRKDWYKSLITKPLVAGLGAMLVGCIAAYPQLLLSPQSVIKLVDTSDGQTAVVVGGQTGTALDGFQLNYLPKNLGYLFGYEPITAALGIIGMVWFLARPQVKTDHLILVSLAGVFLVLFGLLRFTLPHYFSPLVPVLAIFAARMVADFESVIDQRWPSFAFLNSGVFSGILIVPMIVSSLRLDYVLGQVDTRTQAQNWITANVPIGSAIGTDFRFELYPTQESIRLQQSETNTVLGTREQWLSNLSSAKYPAPAFAITNLDVYEIDTLAQFSDLVNRHQLQYVAFEQYQIELANLLPVEEYAVKNGTRVAYFCPGSPLKENLNYALPDDITWPWWAMWQMDFPGPIVQIFSLQSSESGQSLSLNC
jgi:4-amino-4-deoxy-L-arabinose transferase-like glycosyltransferase